MFPYKATFQPVGDAPNISQPTENQWSNPSNYQVDLDTVDWAALAQQWITMKEATTTHVDPELQFMTLPTAPPPPTISKASHHDLGEEQGEAPMEVEHDEDEQTAPIGNNNLYVAPPAPMNIFLGNQSNNGTNANTNASSNASTQSNWSNAKPSETKPWQKKGSRRNNSHSSRSNDTKNYRQPQTFRGDPYNTISPQIYNLKSNESPWQVTNPVGALASAPTSHSHTNTAHTTPHTDPIHFKSGTQLDNVDLMPTTLDAAQRKTLPAWIREGLEKMERGKQREADRIREAKERDEKQRQIRLAESKVISLNPGIVAANIESTAAPLLLKSKFESDSDDDSDSEVDDIDHRGGGGDDGANNSAANKSVADAYAMAKAGSSKASAIVSKPHRSKADILQDIMLSVRKNLTEILLEVTNEQIKDIANETLSKMRSKGLKAQTVQKNALTAITGGLGLVTYDDSDGSKSSSDSDDDDDDEPDRGNKSRNDDESENELMNTIERRKAAFEIKSAEIEDYLAQNDEKEKNWLEKDDESSERSESTADSGNGTPSASGGKLQYRTESGEIQQDKNKLTTSSGRKNDRKGSRFSDAKGLVYNVANTMATLSSTTAGHQSSHTVDANRIDASENSSDSIKKASHVSKSHHSNKHEHSDRRRRSSSSERSRNARRKHSRRDRSHSRHRHRSRSRSPSTDRASKSSKSSRSTRDTFSKEKSYSRSHSHRSNKRGHSRSRSRSRSFESRSSHHRHR